MLASNEKLIAHLKKHGKDRPWSALTKLFSPGNSDDWSRQIARNNGWDAKSGHFTVRHKIEATKQKKENDYHSRENSRLAEKVIELEKDLELAFRVKKHNPQRWVIPSPKSGSKSEATAIIQWSDWHVDELVESATVNGLNEYNKAIAKTRALKLFENGVKLVNVQRAGITIKRLVIHLGGDAIGGYIHPELEQTNTMSPLMGIFYAKDLAVAGLEYNLEHGDFEEIIVVCSRGNHPRLTKKMQFANDYSMNLETFLYWSLADYFKNEKRIVFKIDQSELSYLTVYDKVLRFFHGHQVKFKGGIGGMTVPLYKAIFRWNQNIQAYYNFMCDKHTCSNPTPDCQVNGSLKGYDAMAVSYGFGYQPPLQSFTLLDSKRGITVKAPIFCE